MSVTVLPVIQWMVAAGMALTLAACIYLWFGRPERRTHVIPPGTWALHGVAYYTLVLSGILPTGHELTILLSAILRLHSVLLMSGGLVLFVWRPRRGRRE